MYECECMCVRVYVGGCVHHVQEGGIRVSWNIVAVWIEELTFPNPGMSV